MSDGLMDVIIMEPFDVLEAPQVSFDMFNKTLDKNSKIKTFKCKKLHITRSKAGVIHYDGDPVMSGAEIDVHLEEKGIKVVVNPHADKNARKPNAIQTAFAEFSVILPVEVVEQFEAEACFLGYYKTRQCAIKTVERKAPKRYLLAFSRHRGGMMENVTETMMVVSRRSSMLR